MKVKAWINAIRPRTLPLSMSGILVGSGLAAVQGFNNDLLLIFALLSTLGLQIISNLANDYGDGIKGTDNETRIGPKRAYQSGALSKGELKMGIIFTVIITLALIGILLYLAFYNSKFYLLLFALFGAFAIWASIRYTVGKSAYGYKGLGDLFVFVFFGLLAVLGTMFLFTKFITPLSIFPAVSIGLLSTAVLNLNNLRDFNSDTAAGKNTLVVKFGMRWAKRYHFTLLIVAFLSMSYYIFRIANTWQQSICLLAFLPIAIHFWKVTQIKQAIGFDPELKKVALSTFFMALFFYLGFNIFL